MRKSKVERKTTETEVKVSLNVDGKGDYSINTGIGFFDHMLNLFAKHGMFDLNVECKGDLYVDSHHTVEDVAITLGKAFDQASGDKRNIKRYGFICLPMDESLVRCAVDISGRPFLYTDIRLENKKIGEFDTELLEEFLRSFCFNAYITLHMELIHGVNTHHIIEACFKALGRSLREAYSIDERETGIPSTKGVI